MNRDSSEITSNTIRLLFPFILLFGAYIILNGHLTPGGGFQGGAVLAAVFIVRYIADPVEGFQLRTFQIMEKILFALIIIVPIFFLFTGLNFVYDSLNEHYLILMNIFIGLKVGCGISIIFFRFVLWESR